MADKKFIKKALRLQGAMRAYTGLQTIKSRPLGKARFVNTSHGDVKVLEYGFDSSEIAPLFVSMHGGGFVLGSAEMNDKMNRCFMEEADIKIIDIDYPKAPKNPYPIAVEAVYDVIKHYIENAEIYQIDTGCIGIGGHSAGANLSTVTCIRAKEKGDFSFAFQVLDYPVLDLAANPYAKKQPKGALSPDMMRMFNECYFDGDLETAKTPYISPVYATTEQLAGLPPTLLIVVGRDSLHDEGARYGEMLTAAGVEVELHDFWDSVHGFTYNKTPDAKEGCKLIADFIRKHTTDS